MTKQQDFSMWSMNFILFCLANFLYYGAFYLYIPVLPQYVEMLGGTPADIGLVGGAFGLSSFIIRPYLGKLANEWGRKRMMLLGTISFALLFLLFGRDWTRMALDFDSGEEQELIVFCGVWTDRNSTYFVDDFSLNMIK